MSYAAPVYQPITSTPNVNTVYFTLVTGGVDHFMLANVSSAGGDIARIQTGGGAPDGVFGVELNYKVARFLKVDISFAYSSEPEAPYEVIGGFQIPQGVSEDGGAMLFCSVIRRVVDGGDVVPQLVFPLDGMTIQCRIDYEAL